MKVNYILVYKLSFSNFRNYYNLDYIFENEVIRLKINNEDSKILFYIQVLRRVYLSKLWFKEDFILEFRKCFRIKYNENVFLNLWDVIKIIFRKKFIVFIKKSKKVKN